MWGRGGPAGLEHKCVEGHGGWGRGWCVVVWVLGGRECVGERGGVRCEVLGTSLLSETFQLEIMLQFSSALAQAISRACCDEGYGVSILEEG